MKTVNLDHLHLLRTHRPGTASQHQHSTRPAAAGTAAPLPLRLFVSGSCDGSLLRLLTDDLHHRMRLRGWVTVDDWVGACVIDQRRGELRTPGYMNSVRKSIPPPTAR